VQKRQFANNVKISAPLVYGMLVWLFGIACVSSVESHPSTVSYSRIARGKVIAQNRKQLLIVEFTERWNYECDKLDKTTFADPKVKHWLNENAFFVRFDMGKPMDMDKEIDVAKSFNIFTFPTIVVYAPSDMSKEFDRQSGYQNNEDLLAWLTAVQSGKTSTDSLKEQIASLSNKGGKEEIALRRKLARKLSHANNYAEATEQYLWLWNNIDTKDPTQRFDRDDVIAAAMMYLGARYEPVLARFRQMRDEAERTNREDWLVLNRVLGEQDKSLAWFDQVKKEAGAQEVFHKYERLLERALISRERYEDLALIYQDPISELKHKYLFAKPAIEQNEYDPFPRQAAAMYVAFLAAGRDDIAEQLANESLKLEDTSAMRKALASTAQRANQLRPGQLKWIQEGERITIDPHRAESYLDRGITYAKYKRYAAAIDDFGEAIRLNPKYANAYYQRALARVELKQSSKAMEDFDIAIKLDKKDPEKLMDRARLSASLSRYDSALRDCNLAIRLGCRCVYAFEARGWTYECLGQYDLAVKDFNEAIKLNDRSVYSYTQRGNVYAALKRYDEAIVDYNRAVELERKDPESLLARAGFRCNMKQYDMALADCEAAVKLNPKYYNSYITRGFVYYKKKDYEKALNDFDNAINIDPAGAWGHINRAQIYFCQGKYKQAYEESDKAVTLDSNNAAAFCNRGEASLKLGNDQSALTDLDKSIAIDPRPGNGEATYYRAKLYEKLGKSDLAQKDREYAENLGFEPEASD
jgi:tetratricopeptide (TPR) repeat protein/thioredoxin-related protein